jgi:hypothetical protein
MKSPPAPARSPASSSARVRPVTAVAICVALLSGCAREATDLVRGLDAAREECTAERLRAGAEECVQMFQHLADQGAELMETYMGAIRAAETAMQRRPDLPFDSAGPGDAFSARVGAGPEGMSEGWGDRANRRGSWEGESWPQRDDGGGGRWSDPPSGAGGQDRPDFGYPPYPEERRSARDPGSAMPQEWDRAAPRRGVLLPPDQRLRRPWIDDRERFQDEPPLRSGDRRAPGPGTWQADRGYADGWGGPHHERGFPPERDRWDEP